jgi:N-methylhydantoinase B
MKSSRSNQHSGKTSRREQTRKKVVVRENPSRDNATRENATRLDRTARFNPTTLEIYRALYTSVAEEMGVALRRTAFSPNIKERRDYSCAVFDAMGRVIAQGDHMPVHLGSMPMAVAAALSTINLAPGDVVALNDPFAGGTHLPDVTLIAGVWAKEDERGNEGKEKHRQQSFEKMRRDKGAPDKDTTSSPYTLRPTPYTLPLFYVANRAHHADIGGATPGSMGVATDVYGEGLRIPPVRLVSAGENNEDVWRLLLANVRGTVERRADFEAQIGSLKTGATRLLEIVERRGASNALAYASHLIEYSSRLMRAALAAIPDGVYEAWDALDDDGVSQGEVKINVRVTIRGERARVDFTGSSKQVAGAINAVEAITVSAVAYVFRCLISGDVPASAGLMLPIEVISPRGTIVNATHPAPVAGGNVETSQRIVDALFKALAQALPEKIPAASQGTMNNLTIGGIDSRNGDETEFAYYETVAGGMGARPRVDGMSAVHTHMTNSLNTPIEALEYAYPLRVREYRIRKNSGGRGKMNGGCGVVREIETLVAAQVSLLADRRRRAPYGLNNGDDARVGRDVIIKSGRKHAIHSKGSWQLAAGDRIRIETPGGGGHGKK